MSANTTLIVLRKTPPALHLLPPTLLTTLQSPKLEPFQAPSPSCPTLSPAQTTDQSTPKLLSSHPPQSKALPTHLWRYLLLPTPQDFGTPLSRIKVVSHILQLKLMNFCLSNPLMF